MQLNNYRDIHRGQSVIVCGCGDSLNLLQQPERFVTIGVNDVGRRFTPDYLVVVNPRSQFSGDRFTYVERSQAKALFTQYEDLGVVHPCVVKFRLGVYAGTDISEPQVLHYTQNSPYVALCLAAHMGASRIGLIGVDFTENHFFGRTGPHPLAPQIPLIDEQYRRLGEALRARGIEVFNLSPVSRLSAFPKTTLQQFVAQKSMAHENITLKIVSYATTPIVGAPLALAHCISARTPHDACCVWLTNEYGNGIRFDNGIEWTRCPDEAEARLREADVVIVHNGKVERRHEPLLDGKPLITMAHNYISNVDCGLVEKGFAGVVVGQYQATLPEFAGWSIVPNPLPFWESAYALESKPHRVTICYTPSGTHERYPREHRLYWHSKGYQTTLRVLDRLSQRFPIVVEAVRGSQISHSESMAMKRRAHITIDECVTGSYHRNSLEGLACGSVVVNGVGLLPQVADALQRCIPSAATVPFVYADLENLERVLSTLIELGPETLSRRGVENRLWFQQNWDFARQWQTHWEPVVSRAKTVSRKESRYFLSVQAKSEIASAQSRQADRRFPEGVSVVVPHGGLARLPHLAASLANLSQTAGVSEVIVADMGLAPSAARLARRWAAKYVFIHNSGAFERARALNTGAALAEFDLVLWKDNDLLLPDSFVQIAAGELRSRGLDYLLPYHTIRYLTASDSETVMAGARSAENCKPAKVLYGGRDVSGGAALVRSDFLLRYGGVPDEFRGWGGEDNAWAHKASLFGRTAVTQRSEQHLFHLHHPDSGAFAGKPLSENPYYADNVATLAMLRATRTAEEFLTRFPDTGRRICPWEDSHGIAVVHGESGRAVAGTLSRGLRDLYGIDCVVNPWSGGDFTDARTTIVVDPPDAFETHRSAQGAGERVMVLLSDPVRASALQGSSLQTVRAAPMVEMAAPLPEAVWPTSPAKFTDPFALAIAVVQPLSLMIGASAEPTAKAIPGPVDDELPVWLYWEGECSDWIRLCRETMVRHVRNVRLLDRQAFESLWDTDRDINISRLHVAHRADFVRAFLLARYGGLWIDADCVVMQPLDSVLALLSENDFVAHKDRQGFYPNGFIGARRGSVIASELYRRVAERLRAQQPLGWISLGGEPLTEVLRTASAKWHELPCHRIQPVCWSHPEFFFEVALPAEHELRFDESALCYMLSNTEVQKFVAKHPERDLMAEGTFFRYLVERSLHGYAPTTASKSPLALASETTTVLETIAKLRPRRILEIGVGRGFRGLLIREAFGFTSFAAFELQGLVTDDAVEPAVRKGIYNNLVKAAPEQVPLSITEEWDLAIVDSAWQDWPKGVADACLKTVLETSAYALLLGLAASPQSGGPAPDFTENLISAVPAENSKVSGARHYLFSRNDPQHVARRHQITSMFETIYRDNCRRGGESVSGPGSCLAQTHEIRRRLPFLFGDLGIQSLLDAGCGDLHWLREVRLGVESYIGVDIVPDLITRNRLEYGSSTRRFMLADLTEAPLPRADLIFCRDCLVHFSFADIMRMLRNFRLSGSVYLLTTTFPDRRENQEIKTGSWRPLNLEHAPFHFPRPVRIVNEQCTEGGGIYADKSLGLWRLQELRV